MSSSPGQPRRLAEGRPDRSIACHRFSLSTVATIAVIPAIRSPRLCSPPGVRRFGRSFKYHRLRGVMTAGPEEPNALVTLGEGARREPNSRATTVALHEGLVAESQNRWPSLDIDLLSVNQLLAPFLSAGFLLQDLHVAARLLGAGLRAAYPPRRGSRAGRSGA